jgi:diguanylate cyclase (GGDEF)-like protein
MILHLPTLLVALLLGFALLTLALGVAQRRLNSRPDLRRWLQGCCALLGGFLFLAARPWLPMWVSIVGGNGLIALGLACYGSALYRLLTGGPGPRWLWVAQPVVWLAALAMVTWPQHLRTAVLSVAHAALLAPSVWLIARRGWDAERSLRTVAVTLGLAIAALLVRVVHALLQPDEYTALMQASVGQSLTFLVAFMALLGAGFGFVLAVFERVSRQLEVAANHDGMTGCLNRSATDALLAHLLKRSRREGAPVAFVLMDLDNFKQINDRHGHGTGDEVLRRFADVVRHRLRESDVFGRLGGEEFGLVLPGTDAPGARYLTELIREAVAQMTVLDPRGRPVVVTVSAGITVVAGERGSAKVSSERVVGRADQALYEAKHGGRNRVVLSGANPAPGSLLDPE